jgi:ERCC4-type nuclease
MDGRLFEQLAKMRNQYEQAVVLIEGDVYATQYGDIGEEAITGALTWLAGMSGCGVVTVPSQRYSAMAIRRLAIQQVWGLGYEIKLRTNKPKWEPDVGLYLVEGLPSVGPSTARILMSHFKSAEAVFRATEEELRSIKGVGPKTAEKIRAALTRSFEG